MFSATLQALEISVKNLSRSNLQNFTIATTSVFFMWQPSDAIAQTSSQPLTSFDPSFALAQNTLEDYVPLHRRQDAEQFNPDLVPLNTPVRRRDTTPSETDATTPSDPEPSLEQSRTPYKASPGTTIGIPSGYGASWRNLGFGMGFQESVRSVDRSDGSFGMGFGVGNPRQNVGLQVGLGFPDLSNPFEDGTLGLKLHRQIDPNFSIAVGASGLLTWGEPDGGSSLYGVATKRVPLAESPRQAFSEFTVSLGLGGGQYRSLDDIDNGVESVGVFGSIAVRVIEPVSAIAEWTGQDMNIGVSIVPFRNLSWVITPALTDLTGTAGDKVRFVIGTGYSFSF